MSVSAPKARQARPKKRKLSPAKIVLVVLAVLLSLLVLKVVLILTAEPTISLDYVAEWNRIAKPPNYDPNQNALFDYQKAVSYLVPADQIGVKANYNCSAKWEPDELKDVIQWINANERALDYLESGCNKPYFWVEISPTGKSILEWDIRSQIRIDKLKEICELQNYRAKLRAANKDIAGALRDILVNCKTASQLARSKPMIGQRVGISLWSHTIDTALVILDKPEVRAVELEHFHRQVQEEAQKVSGALALSVEKLGFLDIIQRIYTDDEGGNGHLIVCELSRELFRWHLQMSTRQRSPRQVPALWRNFLTRLQLHDIRQGSDLPLNTKLLWMAMFGPDRRQTVKHIDRFFERLASVQEYKLWELHQRGICSDRDILAGGELHILEPTSDLFYYSCIELHQRLRCAQSALVTVVAVLRYQADRCTLPKSLRELVSAGYLDNLPQDPYSPGPLVYERKGSDFVLCSFGADCDDDGGTPSDWGEGPQGGDQVFWPVQAK